MSLDYSHYNVLLPIRLHYGSCANVESGRNSKPTKVQIGQIHPNYMILFKKNNIQFNPI